MSNLPRQLKSFKDSVHGYIHVPGVVVSHIIDTELFQRLHDVEQTGMKSIFPAARHDRFIHSLGTYFLGKYAFSSLRANATKAIKDEITLGCAELTLLQIENADQTQPQLSESWWDKYELLFSLACLLHDCAHAPFSHTYEIYLGLAQEKMTKTWLESLKGRIVTEADKLKGRNISILDKVMLETYSSVAFCDDYYINYEAGSFNSWDAAEHEKLSATMVAIEYSDAIWTICKTLLSDNVFVTEKSRLSDIEFIARAIIGMKYSQFTTDNAAEQSLKNCFISLLKSDTLDVDSLDYIMRDAYNAGLESGTIDFQRLLNSLTIAPVFVINGIEFKDAELDGLWLTGTVLLSKKTCEQPGFKARGIFNIQHSQYNAAGEPEVQKNAGCDWILVDGTSPKKNPANVIESELRDSEVCFEGTTNIPDFKLECEKSTHLMGKFTGAVCGKTFQNKTNVFWADNADRVEYELVYDRACLSVFQMALDSRNFEYQWVYTHPKVLYHSSFLLCYMLRLSARFLCCKAHQKVSKFGSKKLEFISCESCKHAQKNDPDFQIPVILGLDSYYHKANPRQEYKKIGYQFYRSGDSDMLALFKRILLENRDLGDNKSEIIERYFSSFFSRKHQRPVWKTYFEYRKAIEGIKEPDIKVLRDKLVEPSKTSQMHYKFPEGSILDELQLAGIMNPVVVDAKLKLKSIDRHKTHIMSRGDGVARFSDVVGETNDEVANDTFFYIYGDFDEDYILDPSKAHDLLNKILRQKEPTA
ncbi:MAG: HD domain-containing protein [Coriobacteriia bacterium]|nr:HD domain-containing protein [Coriobacteriia bacterium]